MSSSVTATFVFTDLVDSTATAARLGPEAAEELRQTHFRLLRGAVSASAGTEVKNLGDGLMVMYSSPSRALAGAVGMQQAIEHHNRSGGQLLGVRIGISAGEAVEEDRDYFGDPVVEAARLCATAVGGQILATELVRMMVGRHATQTFVERGPVELKGIPQPVDVVEVQWEPEAVAGSVPLPARLVGAATDALFGFFGRSAELAVLEEARKQAHSNQRCHVAFVSGEAGMGKTALVAQAARAAHAEGSIVLFGHSSEDAGIAYQPWIEVVSTLVRDGDPELVAELRPAQRTALARLAPDIDAANERLTDPDTERLLLWEGTTEFLTAAGRQAPVFVVLDDVHWADTASLQLLRHVIASTAAMDVTIACTYRDTDLTRGDPLNKLLADLHREANVIRIAIAGLEDDELVELMTAAAGHELDETSIGLAHALRRETDGNPFFTAEMLRHLGESGGIVLGDDGRWTVAGELEALGLPSSVRDVVGRRVERLGDEALRVLCLASVIGREFDINMLAVLTDIDEDPLLDLMDAAVGAAVLVESADGARYRFAHALTQHTLYDELSAARRQRAHQRIGEILESRTPSEDVATLAELARHWIAATRPADFEKALGYARRVGDAARDALAPEDAIGWYQQALDLLARQAAPDQRTRAALLAALGTVQRQASQAEYRDTLLEAAALAPELGDSAVLVDAALGFTQWSAGLVGDDDVKRVIQAALDALASDATPTRARLLAALAAAHDATDEWQLRRDFSLEALDVARGAGDDATFVEVIGMSYASLASGQRRDEEIDDIARAVTTAERIGDPVLRARLGYARLWARYQQADLPGLHADLAELQELAEAIGLTQSRWEVAMLEIGVNLLVGDAVAAEAANDRTLELGANMPEALGAYGGMLYPIRWHQDRLAEIADAFLEAARENPFIAVLRAEIPRMLCELGRVDEARERLAAEAAANFEFPDGLMWLMAMSIMVDAAASTRDADAARTLVERLTPFADHVITSGALFEGALARPLARAATLLGDYDQAEEWFAIAHDIHGRMEAPFWIAMGQLDHADLCLERRAADDVERAREFATAAAATADEFGCPGLSKRAAQILAQL